MAKSVRERANRAYFATEEWRRSTWRGVPTYKYPSDLLTYARIIGAVRPNVVIETGTAAGGSALFFRDVLDLNGLHDSLIVTIDVLQYLAQPLPHDCVQIIGSCLDEAVVSRLSPWLGAERILVSLDSDHLETHVREELKIYAPMVTPGSYLVVEDTFLGFWGMTEGETEERFRDGSTWHALQAFLPEHTEFTPDDGAESYITMNPGGWLRRS